MTVPPPPPPSEVLDPPLINPPLSFLSLNVINYDVLKLGYINEKRLLIMPSSAIACFGVLFPVQL